MATWGDDRQARKAHTTSVHLHMFHPSGLKIRSRVRENRREKS